MNDIDAIKKATEGNPNVVAVFFETIQGEGGINSACALNTCSSCARCATSAVGS